MIKKIILGMLLVLFIIASVSGEDEVTNGTRHNFDTSYNTHNSLVQIDSTHYLNVYAGAGTDGVAVVLTVNQTDWTITNGTLCVFDVVYNAYNSLVKIDSTHYLNVYSHSGGADYAVVLTVDPADWSVTNGTKHNFVAAHASAYNSLVQIDSTHYLVTYTVGDTSGHAVVLTVNPIDWTITHGGTHCFNVYDGLHNSLVQIDSTHYLNVYQGAHADGFAVILTVNPVGWTITSGGVCEFDVSHNEHNSLVQIDSTHYLNAYQGSGYGYAVVLTVNQTDWTITRGGPKHAFTPILGIAGDNSLIQIDSTRYLLTYSDVDGDGQAVVLTVNQTDWTITNGTAHEFAITSAMFNSLAQINSRHYLNVYSEAYYDGFGVVLTANVSVNTPPNITMAAPSNNTYIPPECTEKSLFVLFSDADGDLMNVTITHEEGSQTWTGLGDNSILYNMPITGGSVAGETYSWNVSITDGIDTTYGYYYIHVPWLTCSMNESAPEIFCAIDGLVNTTFEGNEYPASLSYWDLPPTTMSDGLWMNTTANYTVGLSDGLLHKYTYEFWSWWTDTEGYGLDGNKYNFTLYECYENETPTGCGVGYNCSGHTCILNGSSYTSTNGTYSLVITDLGNVSSGYTPLITAQYLNGTDPIVGATCYYTSNGFTLALDNLNEDADHYYSSWVIIGPLSGSKSCVVTCHKAGYPTLQAVDYFNVGGSSEDYSTEIEWVNAPTETIQYTIEELEGNYLTTSGQGIVGANCDITIGLSTYPMTDTGGGSYSKSFSFDFIATYSYFMECSKAGYDTAISDTITIVVHSEVFNETDPDDVNITITSPAEGWNCTNPLDRCKEGNIALCMICPFYNLMGGWFFGIILFFTLGLAYMQTDTIAVPAVLAIVIGGVYAMYLPSEVHAVAFIAVAFGITALLYLQFKGDDV